jgi:hypothetical protein
MILIKIQFALVQTSTVISLRKNFLFGCQLGTAPTSYDATAIAS